MKSVIVLFGKPGAGKGTRLSQFLKGREDQFEYLGVSVLLKKEIASGTELGKKAKSYMDAGMLVPDELIIAMVLEKLSGIHKPVFLDGFPRTIPQATAMLEAGIIPVMVVELSLDDKIILERVRDRIVCKTCGESYTIGSYKHPKVEGVCDICGGAVVKRNDDREDIVLNRFEVYNKETYPLLDVLAKANVPIFTIDNSNSKTAAAQFEALMAPF